MSTISNPQEQLSAEEKRALLAKLLEEKASATVESHPLSFGQNALWFMYQLDPTSAAYNIMFAAHIRPELDVEAFRRAFQKVVDRHAMLRATYATQNGLPVQQIHDHSELPLEVIDAADLSEDQLRERILEESDRPFDLRRGPVMRVQLYERSATHRVLLLVFHHMVIDFWSLDLLLEELQALYAADVDGTQPQLRPGAHYADYVRWQVDMLGGAEGERLAAYWTGKLAGPLPVLNLPTDRPRPSVQTYRGASHTFRVDPQLADRLKQLAKDQGTTLYTTLLAAFQTLMHRYSGQEDILVGSPMVGRSRADQERMLGYFVNPIVLRADLSGQPTFCEFLDRTRRTVLEGLEHQDYPFPVLVERLQPARDPSRSPLFQVAFVWDRPRKGDEQKAGSDAGLGTISMRTADTTVEVEPFQCEQRGAAFDLMVTMFELGDALSGSLQYNQDLYDESTVVRIVGHFLSLLEGIVADPDQSLAELPLLSGAEYQQIVVDWNATERTYPDTNSIHELIETQAKQTPAAIALVAGDQQITYDQLNRRANQLAGYLQELGVGPESLVAICMDRGVDVVVSILATLKAGGAYVPLDPAYPEERVTFMLDDSQALVLLTQKHLLPRLPARKASVVCVDADWSEIARRSEEEPDSGVSPENLAYIIYTSGSTGRPKGVAIEHRSAITFIHWAQEVFSPEELAGVLFSTSVCFDLSIFEMFVPLSAGGTVILADNALHLPTLSAADRVTLINSVPSAMTELLRNGQLPKSVRTVNLAGEPLTTKLVKRIYEEPSVQRVYDLFGPSEDTTYSTFALRNAEGPYTVGRPIANTQVYLVDAHMNPVPVGVPGEMYLGGAGLARGYYQQPELTNERFVPHPFRSDPGARLYKTGDLARYMPDGNIEFLGRIDHQVKIRGFRIELGEIEAVLSKHPAVKDLVVVAREDSPGDKRLVSYLVFKDEEPNVTELRNYLKEKLPSYMVPAAFVTLDELPLTPNGKVDRQALPVPDSARPELAHEYVAPRNRAEQVLVDIWESVLGLDKVGVHDNFFDLGGASTQSLETAALAAEEGVEFTPAMLFQHQTVAELAAASMQSAESVDLSEGNGHADSLEIEPASDADVATALATAPKEATRAETDRCNVVIESLGVYLPPKVVSTSEVVKACKKKIWFPLESMTGIKTRRMAGETEFSIDLAKQAVAECIDNSKYRQEDIDLVVCCNISRGDNLKQYSFEPSSAMKLKKHFGLDNALIFDISNACAGMFTGVKVVESFLQIGAIRCGMVVSGEYITGITDTAQKEINEFIDPRLACLTVGDSGAAIILEEASNNDVGFHQLEIYTLSRYADLCVAKLTDQEHGGAIMLTDPIKHTAIAIKHSVSHALHLFKRNPWSPEEMQHLIMHQTSERSLNDGARAINKAFKKKICNKKNTVNNLTERGNTATTTHYVAIWDNVLNGTMHSGDNVAFGISGSGQTVGTAIYTFDDLPDRLRRAKLEGQKPRKLTDDELLAPRVRPELPRVRIESIGTLNDPSVPHDTFAMSKVAGENCLAASQYERSDIEAVIFCGVNRTDGISEPAIAAMIAGDLEINDIIETEDDKKTLCFDVFNGSVGFLNGCDVAARLIQSGAYKRAMVCASEIDYNAKDFPDELHGLKPTATAVILDAAPQDAVGFGAFSFRYFPEMFDALEVYGYYRDGRKQYLHRHKDPAIEELYLKCVTESVESFLVDAGLESSQIKAVLPPQFSSEFLSNLALAIDIPRERIIDIVDEHDGLDLYTSSLPYSLEAAYRQNRVAAGDVGLIINVGSGLQVGCALYHF